MNVLLHIRRTLVTRLPVVTLIIAAAAILCTPPAQAASEEIISAARVCVQQAWTDKAGAERAKAYRATVDCLNALYVRVAAGAKSSESLEKELAKRLGDLEAAYHASRDVCRLQEKLGLEDGGCGTISPSPFEFVQLLKTMILDADAGWVRRDPALAKALRLDQ